MESDKTDYKLIRSIEHHWSSLCDGSGTALIVSNVIEALHDHQSFQNMKDLPLNMHAQSA